MAKPKFSAGMASSPMVREKTRAETMINNDIDTGYNLQYIPFEKIEPNELNKKYRQDDAEQVCNSILVNGLLHALVVYYKVETNTYRLISGEQRYHGFDLMGPVLRKQKFPRGIPCNVDKRPASEIDEKIKINAANLDGRMLSPEERSILLKEMVDLYQQKQARGEIDNTVNVLIEKYNLTERMIRKYIAANRMIPELQQLFSDAKINITESEKFSTFSEEMQMQIYRMITESGKKPDATDLKAIRKIEHEKKELEKKTADAYRKLAEKEEMVKALEIRITSLEKEKKSIKTKATESTNKPVQPSSEQEDLKEEIERLNQLLRKEEADRKRAQSNFEKLKQENQEKKERKISLSDEEFKKAANYAKAENLHNAMFAQLKELEKMQELIKNDGDLKIQFKVIADRLSLLLE